jgi:hypothetical protein
MSLLLTSCAHLARRARTAAPPLLALCARGAAAGNAGAGWRPGAGGAAWSPWLARCMAAHLSGCAEAEPALDVYRVNVITGGGAGGAAGGVPRRSFRGQPARSTLPRRGRGRWALP